MRDQHTNLRARWWRASIGIGLFALALTRCGYGDYPLAPTFCDDWCRVLLRVPCDQEPENCVRDCEADRTPSCAAEHEALRACYGAAPRESFACAGRGFGSDVRPLPGLCESERDALIACAAPEEWQCLQICRAVDAAQPPESEPPLPSASQCPARAIPCGNLCRRLSDGDVAEWLERARAGDVPDAGDALDAGVATSSVAQARTVFACAAERGRRCREQAGGLEPRELSWQDALLRCALTGGAVSEP